MKYKMRVQEVLNRDVDVEANSLDEALDKIEDLYYNTDKIVLDASDLASVEFLVAKLPTNNKPQPIKRKLKRNRIRCKLCGDIIESKSVHDFQQCSCGKCFVDGGTDYMRVGGYPDNIEDLSEWEELEDEKI